VFSKLFKKTAQPKPAPEPAQVYTNLRNQVLKLVPQEVGIVPSGEIPSVWGVLMETGYPEAVATLVSLSDGTTSLYFGNGGGMIGGGEQAAVAEATKSFVAGSEQFVQHMMPTKSFPLPAVGRVKFYIMTFSGAFTAEADESALGSGKDELPPLFYSGHGVLTQLRLTQGQKK
jgi:hypothetical protein